MLDLSPSGYVAINRNVEGRIGQYDIGRLGSEQPLIVGTNSRVATKQPMISKHPEITLLRSACLGDFRRSFIFGAGLFRSLLRGVIQDQVNFAEREASNLDLIKLHVLKELQF